MQPVRKLLLISGALLTVLILFNLVIYYSISRKNEQKAYVDEARTITSNQQILVQRIARNTGILFMSHSFTPDQYKDHVQNLRDLVEEFSGRQEELKSIIYRGDLPLDKEEEQIQKLFSLASLNHNNIVFVSLRATRDNNIFGLNDVRQQEELRTNEASYLKSMLQVTALFRSMDQQLSQRISFLNRAMTISLVLSLLVVAILIVIPLTKQNNKNYQQLQDTLEEVRNSESMLKVVIDSSPDFIFILDRNQKYRMVNKALAEGIGLKPEEFLNKDDLELGLSSEMILGNEAYGKRGLWMDNKDVLDTGRTIYVPEITLFINGRTRIVSMLKSPLTNSEGEIWGMLGFAHDITDRIIAEKKIQESEKKYRYLFQANPMPMWIFDAETLQFLEVNKMAIDHYGYSAEEFSQMTILDIRPKKEVARFKKYFAGYREASETPVRGVWTHLKKDGEKMFVEIITHPISYNGREAILVLSKDVTRKIELQNELMEEKIAHQKEIARATLSVQEKERNEIGKELHDNVNQILTSAKLHLEFIENELADKEKHRKTSINLVTSAIQEIRRLSKSLVPPSLNDVGLVQSIHDLVENINGFGSVKLEFSYGELSDTIDADLQLTIFRIIQEQTTNILKYAEATKATIALHEENGFLKLSVSDNGKGFDPSQHRKGIGITNIINRAEIYQGNVDIFSTPGNGCRLQVVFKMKKSPRRRIAG
ncbi:MAG TPA: PAS domain S-box protein [Flavisolibacter sp.]